MCKLQSFCLHDCQVSTALQAGTHTQTENRLFLPTAPSVTIVQASKTKSSDNAVINHFLISGERINDD